MNAAAETLSPKHARPAHAEPSCEIRVIAGGLLDPERAPQHARAMRGEREGFGLRGVPYNLGIGERIFATGAGIVFTAVSLAAILL